MSLRPPPRLSTLPAGVDNVFRIPDDTRLERVLASAAELPADRTDWGHDNLGLKALHERGVLGAGAVVAVLDTGTATRHPDLSPQRWEGGAKDRDWVGEGGVDDGNSHGSHVAGIVLAAMDGAGIRGAAPHAKLQTMKVLGRSGSGGSDGIAAAIRRAADDGADVISMSLGSSYPDAESERAVNYAVSKGCWVAAAAGNSGPGAVDYPGAYPNCLSVAATDQSNRRAGFSSTNPHVDVAAPGVQILSCLPGGRWGVMSGTSMATPYVAGCLALVRGELKRLGLPIPTQRDMMEAVARTAKDLGQTGRDDEFGAGLIDPAKLLAEMTKGATQPPTPPAPPPVVPPAPVKPKVFRIEATLSGLMGGKITGTAVEAVGLAAFDTCEAAPPDDVRRPVDAAGPLDWIDRARKAIEFLRMIRDILDKLQATGGTVRELLEESDRHALNACQAAGCRFDALISVDDLRKWIPIALKNLGIAAPIILDGIAAGKRPFAILLEVIAALSLNGLGA